ncbi:iron complex transport system substrate-binding protein [Streptomyces sp. Amel2xB2]|uniref:ABC transporter substrate-binding protein n=1 Tax=Streptomyces sp. Amel2xB2 TaxID=1305829 RepID=UPI000DBAB2E0|nr:ABC transporter substrate-binding protein [Streptomyces sp. Amel2xB2]RAJ59831.1 iron complex transport system substrate-binding protein [Streptomyces sp. Amel2xB2]
MPVSSASPSLSRRGLLAAGGAAGLGALLTACGSEGGSNSGSGKGSWSFTDDRKKKISLDGRPQRVVAYVGTAAALHDFGAGDAIVGVFGPTKKKNGEADVLAGDLDVKKLEIIGNAYGEFDIEKYAKTHPELLVTNMYVKNALWYVPDESKAKILKLAPSLALKTAETSMLDAIKRFAELAGDLGADLKAKRVTDAKERFEKASERLRKAAKASGGLKVMAASGAPDLMYVSDPSANADLRYFKELGVDVVVPEKVSEQGFFEELSWENADKYKADVIMLDNRTQALQPPALKSKPTWSDLPAVKAGQVTTWDAEPRFSYAGAAPLLEQLAKAVEDGKKVG